MRIIKGKRFDIPSSTSLITLFTADERTGDFGALCSAGFDGAGICKGTGQLYNPCASFTAPCTPSSPTAVTRQPFSFNIIPAAMISPRGGSLFSSSLYPRRSTITCNITLRIPPASAYNVDQGDLKIDYRPTQKDTISYRFTRAYQNNPSTNSFVLFSNCYGTAPILNTVGDWTRTLTNNLLNDARFGYSHITLNTGNSWASSVASSVTR